MMFVRVGMFQALPDKADELQHVYEREAIPRIRRASGNLGAFLLRQHQSPNTFMAMTIWDTAASADRYEKSGEATTVVDLIRYAFAGPPTLSTYEAVGLSQT